MFLPTLAFPELLPFLRFVSEPALALTRTAQALTGRSASEMLVAGKGRSAAWKK